MIHKIRPSRVEKKFVARYHLPDQPELGYEMVQLIELSTSGMLLSTAKIVPPGTLVDVDLNLPSVGRSLSLKGKVVTSRESGQSLTYHMALRFVYPEPETINALKKTVAFLWKKNGKPPEPDKELVKRAKRAPRTILLRYQPISVKKEPLILNQAVNISISGILFRTEKAYRVNQLMQLHLSLPMMSDVPASRGRVARCNRLREKEFETAVAFTHIEKPVRKAILQMTQSQ